MTIRRIANIKDLGDRVFSVRFEGNKKKMLCCKAHLDLLKFENEMLQLEISDSVIETHRDLIVTFIQNMS